MHNEKKTSRESESHIDTRAAESSTGRIRFPSHPKSVLGYLPSPSLTHKERAIISAQEILNP